MGTLPKTIYSWKKTVEIAAASAVCHLNDGVDYVRNMFGRMQLHHGVFANKGLENSASKCKQHSDLHASEWAKRRKELRSITKGWIDKINDKEVETYGSGMF